MKSTVIAEMLGILGRAEASRARNELPAFAQLRSTLAAAFALGLYTDADLDVSVFIDALERAQSAAEVMMPAAAIRQKLEPLTEDEATGATGIELQTYPPAVEILPMALAEAQQSEAPPAPAALPAHVISVLIGILDAIDEAQTLDDVARGVAVARQFLHDAAGTSGIRKPEAPAADQTAPAETDQAEGASAPEVEAENAGGN